MKSMELDTYSASRVEALADILREFHELGLIHGDPYPRNMMVVESQPKDRILWVDFDCAQVVQKEDLPSWAKFELNMERRIMDEFAQFIVSCPHCLRLAYCNLN